MRELINYIHVQACQQFFHSATLGLCLSVFNLLKIETPVTLFRSGEFNNFLQKRQILYFALNDRSQAGSSTV